MNFELRKIGQVRTRIAPSPTGFLHIGTARTALFNYLFAKKYQGSFVLRIEDTDLERSDPKFEKDILENLKWLGIEWSEGPDIGGPFAPYRQSERLNIYRKYLETLLEKGKAYYCFCSEEELEAQRQYALSRGLSWHYNGKCAQLEKEIVEEYLKKGKKSIIRFKTPIKKVVFEDLVRGKIEFDSALIGDFSIAKDLNTPLYNFAVVIDDFEMKITHVLRGEDHISNTPKQILLQEALNFPQPFYGHLPLILGPDRTKLSKRHGAVSVSEYRKIGYLPEALVNFMAFLGWNPGTEREIYSMSSLIKDFSLEKIQKSGAVFNIKKLDFLNGFYIRQKSLDKLTELCLPYLIEKKLISPLKEEEGKIYVITGESFPLENYKITETGEIINLDIIKKMIGIYQERLKKLSEISELIDFFFKDNLEYDKNLLKWKDGGEKETLSAIDKLREIFSKLEEKDFEKNFLEKILLPIAEEFPKEIGMRIGDRGYLLWPLRVALTGKESSAGPFEIAEILGKEKVLKRLNQAREKIIQS